MRFSVCTGWNTRHKNASHLYRVVLPTDTNVFPMSPLSLPFPLLFSSHLISSHPNLKLQIWQVSNQDSITKFTSFQITISTHHITYYINLIHLIKFSQQHNNQDSQELSQKNNLQPRSCDPWGRARPTAPRQPPARVGDRWNNICIRSSFYRVQMSPHLYRVVANTFVLVQSHHPVQMSPQRGASSTNEGICTRGKISGTNEKSAQWQSLIL
jgi:hypothetical protein